VVHDQSFAIKPSGNPLVTVRAMLVINRLHLFAKL
jgi:hypothetical protein